MTATNLATAPGATVLKTCSSKFDGTTNFQNVNKSDPVIGPRTSSRADVAADSRTEMDNVVPVVPKTNSSVDLAPDPGKQASNVVPVVINKTHLNVTDLHKSSNNRVDLKRANVRFRYRSMGNKSTESNENVDCNLLPAVNGFDPTSAWKRNLENVQISKSGKAEVNLSVDPELSYSFQNSELRLSELQKYVIWL